MANPNPARIMPARGDRGAPTFDANSPRQLNRFFTDIEYLFESCAVTENAAKKSHALRYLDVDDASLWQTLAEYEAAGDAGSWNLFKQAVYALYPGSEDASRYTVADMRDLVRKTRESSLIKSMADLGSFYRQFLAITSHLVAQRLISDLDQQSAFRDAFHPVLWDAIKGRLQIKLPDHPAGASYAVRDIHAAAIYILTDSNTQSLSNSPTTSAIVPAGTYIPSISSALPIKQDDFIALIASVVESTLNQRNARHAPSTAATASSSTSTQAAAPRGPRNCNFCGESGHFLRECLVLADYINTGKCKRNEQNLLVLPSGQFLPNAVSGANFKARFDEYYRLNPTQAPVSNMMFGISGSPSLAPISSDSEERILSLEAEIYALRNKKQSSFEPVIRTRAQRAQEASSSKENTHSPSPAPVGSQPAKEKGKAPSSTIPPSSEAIPAPVHTVPESNSSYNGPEHPFAQARDAAYAPPQDRNIGTVPAAPKKSEPAYRTVAPIYNEKVAKEVYDRAMASEITITHAELLSLAPEVRNAVQSATTNRRISPAPATSK
ncbi:hypothetical protein BDQ12DRAFT_761515, partial [Crucibulum laeve]